MDEATAPWGRCVNVAKWKQLVLTLWMRSNGAVETQWHHKWLRGVFVQVQSTYHCVYTANGCVPWARQQSYCGEVGDLMVQMKMRCFVKALKETLLRVLRWSTLFKDAAVSPWRCSSGVTGVWYVFYTDKHFFVQSFILLRECHKNGKSANVIDGTSFSKIIYSFS